MIERQHRGILIAHVLGRRLWSSSHPEILIMTMIALWARPEHAYKRVVTHRTAEVPSLATHYGVRLPDDVRDYRIRRS